MRASRRAFTRRAKRWRRSPIEAAIVSPAHSPRAREGRALARRPAAPGSRPREPDSDARWAAGRALAATGRGASSPAQPRSLASGVRRGRGAARLLVAAASRIRRNLGALLRTADAAGLPVSRDGGRLLAHPPRTVRASMGVDLRLPAIERCSRRSSKEVQESRFRGHRSRRHVRRRRTTPPIGAGRVALLRAVRGPGSPSPKPALDRRVSIPMAPGVESLGERGGGGRCSRGGEDASRGQPRRMILQSRASRPAAQAPAAAPLWALSVLLTLLRKGQREREHSPFAHLARACTAQPCIRRMLRTMVRPIPVPSFSLGCQRSPAWWKRSKIFSRSRPSRFRPRVLHRIRPTNPGSPLPRRRSHRSDRR